MREKEQIGEELDKTMSDIPKRVQGEQVTMNGDTVYEEDGTFGKVIYFSIFIVCILLRKDRCNFQRKM